MSCKFSGGQMHTQGGYKYILLVRTLPPLGVISLPRYITAHHSSPHTQLIHYAPP